MKTRVEGLEQMRAFLEGTGSVEFEIPSRAERHARIVGTLDGVGYRGLKRKERGVAIGYLCKVTGYSRQQMTRWIAQWRETGVVEDGRRGPAKPFATRYPAQDVALLAAVDTWHGTLSGPATKKLCERALECFGDRRFERLARISVSRLYNLRRPQGYRRKRGKVEKTKPTRVNIGERRVPRPEGRPGFLRMDSVHSGDWNGVKGLYVINMVDEVTQYQMLLAVRQVTGHHMLPVLEALLNAFPFAVLGFHADNGSEYVNGRVAKLLNRLVAGFTKSRPRRSNGNALVESKNGPVVRKHLGYAHIPTSGVPAIDAFLRTHPWPYLNCHRPCFFPVTELDATGRQRKRYLYKHPMTPFEKLKSLAKPAQYLKEGWSIKKLEILAGEMNDNESARHMNTAREKLFRLLGRTSQVA